MGGTSTANSRSATGSNAGRMSIMSVGTNTSTTMMQLSEILDFLT